MKKLFVFVLIGVMSLVSASGDLVIVKKDEVKKLYDSGKALFVDARGKKLYQRDTIMGSVNIPVDKYDALKSYLPVDKIAPIVVFCNGFKCEKSDELAVLMQKDGYKGVKVYKGGVPEWKESGYPLMGLVRECKDSSSEEAYKPKTEAITIRGAKVHLLPGEKSMVDQFWFAPFVKKGIPANIQMVDVRKPEQFKESHIKGAINVPFVDGKIDTTKFPKDKLVILYCNTGMMSTDAITSIKNTDGILMLDANVECDGQICAAEPNEVL